MGVTLLSGVPGVGTSTVCEMARRQLGDQYELINFGDVMLEQAAARGLATDRSELPTLSQRETRRLQRRAGEYVADRSAVREVLLTTYLAVETESGFLPGLPESVLTELEPDRFVLIEADPETILERRQETERRYDTEASRRTVEFQQDLNRAAAFDYAMAANAPIRLVENEGNLDAAATELVTVLDSVTSS